MLWTPWPYLCSQGQKTFVASVCVDTEVAITSIFTRARSPLIAGGEANTGLKLTLGFGQP